jgi:hypothetical protein
LRSAGPPKYERVDRRGIVDEVEPRIRELLQAFPTMPATAGDGPVGRRQPDARRPAVSESPFAASS